MNVMIFRNEATELTVHVGAAVSEEVPVNMKLAGRWLVVSGSVRELGL